MLKAIAASSHVSRPSHEPISCETLGHSVKVSGIWPGNTQQSAYHFTDMHLTVGDRLQVQVPEHLGSERSFVRLIGYLEGSSMMVTVPVLNGIRLHLLEGDRLMFRTFSRQNAFAFSSSVLKACKLPFDYVHLSFPERIHGTIVRKAMRVRTEVLTEVHPLNLRQQTPMQVTIENISAAGALICADQSLGVKGELLLLRFALCVHGIDVNLRVQAKLVNVARQEHCNAGLRHGCFHHGVEFRDLGATDVMAIKSFVYQQGYEHPMTVV